MTDLPLSIRDAAEVLRSGSLKSVDLARASIERADLVDKELGVYITRMDETALEAAAQADADFAAGVDRGPLQGIPLVVKDIITTDGAPTTAQSLVLVGRFDAVLTPTSPVPAPLVDGMTTETSAMRPNFTSLWNFIGLPAVSAPMGFVDGLPVGLQIVGKAWGEATVFRAADAYQRLTDWHCQAPPFPSALAA